MAHKHNRRRVRPRGRNHTTLVLNYDISGTPSPTFNSVAPYPSSNSSTSSRQQTPSPSFRGPSNTGLAFKQWHTRNTAWQTRDLAQRKEAVKIEAEQIKLFGGEPGDDIALCYKMMEVFEGMNWIDSLE
jgi:hypothetical protein